jgi:hypothetical protein
MISLRSTLCKSRQVRTEPTALNHLAGSDESSATFPLGMAPKTLRQKIPSHDIIAICDKIKTAAE